MAKIERCKVHGVPLKTATVTFHYCPVCKAEAARRVGRLGGRPKGSGKKRGQK
jgi:hypothetical protein